jgi:hypothetical protein
MVFALRKMILPNSLLLMSFSLEVNIGFDTGLVTLVLEPVFDGEEEDTDDDDDDDVDDEVAAVGLDEPILAFRLILASSLINK